MNDIFLTKNIIFIPTKITNDFLILSKPSLLSNRSNCSKIIHLELFCFNQMQTRLTQCIRLLPRNSKSLNLEHSQPYFYNAIDLFKKQGYLSFKYHTLQI